MRLLLATIALGVSTVPALAVAELDGKWRLSNGAPATISNGKWTVSNHSYGDYSTHSGWIRKIGPNKYEFGGGDVRIPRTCTLSGGVLRCNLWGASWRRR